MKTTIHIKPKIKPFYQSIITALMVLSATSAHGVIISEDFTGTTTNHDWYMPKPGDGVSTDPNSAQNNACLTAGTGTALPTATTAGRPPRCANPATTDTTGKGALRLTPATQFQAGGIVSAFDFPTNDGVEITFTTYTYGVGKRSGADGMSFFLADADKPVTMGALGGSLGYSCSNVNPVYSGVDGGYFGIGMDEYGNYVNPYDNTNSGVGFKSNTIAIRGAGSINIGYLGNADRFLQDVYTRQGWGIVPNTIKTAWNNKWRTNPTQLRDICKNGTLTLSNTETNGKGTLTLSEQATDPKRKLYNYRLLDHVTFNRNEPNLYSSVNTRAAATPIMYRIKITPDGKASVWYSRNGGTYSPAMLDRDIVSTNGPLPRAFRFGFTGATGGWYNNHEVTCFKAAPANESQGSASVSLPNAQAIADTQVYFSLYNPQFWTGQVVSKSLVRDPNGNYGIAEQANWDASCNLTGGKCESTGATNVPAQNWQSRTFWTWNGSRGVSLDWTNLTSTQQNQLKAPTESDSDGQQRLNFLKGDRSQEQVSAGVGLFRKRQGVLGDIINSSPTWVAYPNNDQYNRTWNNLRGGATPENNGQQTYAQFIADKQSRTNVVYAGSNDGFLHGFRSGSYSAANQYNQTDNDGREVLAYMPAAVLSRMYKPNQSNLDFSHAQYTHNFYNDAAPAIGDVFYQGKWHTWLMSGLGAGGNTVYALDITDPNSFSGGAGTNVKGEWSYNANDPIWKNLGNSYGTPVFGRFHDGNWGAVFGNGWCSSQDAANGNCTASTGPAGIYVMSINQADGKPSFRFISTDVGGTAEAPNGIAYVTPVDIDGDVIYDYAYAGDLKGNVWRFDLKANNSDIWATTKPQKIFTAQANQPISTKILASQVRGSNSDVILNFGTGLRQEGYLGQETTYATGTQSLYGLRDSTVKSFPTGGTNTSQITLSQLEKQTVTAGTNVLSTESANWATQTGWYMNLSQVTMPGNTVAYEQVIYNPILEAGKYLLVNTFINGSSPMLSCSVTNATGYTYPVSNITGAGLKGFWTGDFTGEAYRKQYDASGSPLLVTIDNDLVFVHKKFNGQHGADKVFAPIRQPKVRRLNWRELF